MEPARDIWARWVLEPQILEPSNRFGHPEHEDCLVAYDVTPVTDVGREAFLRRAGNPRRPSAYLRAVR